MREYLILYAFSFVGTPYKYGGNTPLDGGMDCSGYLQEILKAGGILPVKRDFSAQDIYDYIVESSSTVKAAGAVAFYGSNLLNIDHVGFIVDNVSMLSAAGGGRSTLTMKDAAINKAFIKLRPIDYRTDLLTVLMPSYRD